MYAPQMHRGDVKRAAVPPGSAGQKTEVSRTLNSSIIEEISSLGWEALVGPLPPNSRMCHLNTITPKVPTHLANSGVGGSQEPSKFHFLGASC